MANRVDNAKAPAPDKATNGAPEANGAAAAAAPASGGIKTYLPLIANLVLMPVLAYAMTAFVLVPKLAKSGGGAEEPAHAEAESHGDSHGGGDKAHGSSGGGAHGSPVKDPITGKTKISVPLSKKTLVNVSGTMGTRYLLAEFILVGSGSNFKDAVEKSDAELRDAAASALCTKTINDLEKPGIRNLIRTELITIFNSILGKGAVNEIYMTEFAIQ